MERDRYLSIALRSALLFLFLWMIRGILVPIALGALVALLLSPLLGRLQARLGKRRELAPIVLTVGTMFLIVIPFVFVAIDAVRSMNQFLTRDWSPTIAKVQAFLTNGIDVRGYSLHIGGQDLETAIQSVGQRAATYAASLAGVLATELPEVLLSLFLFSITVFYCLRDGEALVAWMLRLSPFEKKQTLELFASIRETVNGAMLGTLVTSLVQGGLTLLALFVFRVPNAFLLGVVATLLSLIPLLGTTPVTLGSAIYLFALSRIAPGVAMLVAAVIIGLSDNVVRPWVQSSQTSMHPLIALLGIFGGLEMFGALGVFLGPVIAAMAVWTVDTYMKLLPPAQREATQTGNNDEPVL